MNRHLTVVSGLASVAFGMFLVYQIGFVDGLFTSHVHWIPHNQASKAEARITKDTKYHEASGFALVYLRILRGSGLNSALQINPPQLNPLPHRRT